MEFDEDLTKFFRSNDSSSIHEVNASNLSIYMASNNVENITKESLQKFFGNNLTHPNKNGEYLTNILACRAFRGSCTIEKTTKLFSFIYEIINPNLPGKTLELCSIIEFLMLSASILTYLGYYYDEKTDSNLNYENCFDYLEFMLQINIKNGLDLRNRDCLGYSIIFHLSMFLVVTNQSGNVERLCNKKKINLLDYLDSHTLNCLISIRDYIHKFRYNDNKNYYHQDLSNYRFILEQLIANNYPNAISRNSDIWIFISKNIDYDFEDRIDEILTYFQVSDEYLENSDLAVSKTSKGNYNIKKLIKEF